MPNASTHAKAGITAGITAAAVTADWKNQIAALTEIAGGGFGGYWGGLAPDLVDPPTNPNHRGAAHGGLAIAVLLALPVKECKATLREWAERCAANAASSESELERFAWTLAATLLRFLAGVLEGFRAGYGSHLAMDFTTPKSLPLLV